MTDIRIIVPTAVRATAGDLVHGASHIISGSSFGTKSPAAPLLWDDCNHGQSMSTRWDAWGPSSAAAGYNLDYYIPGTDNPPSVALPHSNAGTKVMAGAHLDGGSTGGWNVGPILSVSFSNGDPLYVYYLHRRSPAYNNSGDNYKTWYVDGSSASWYGSSTDGYIELKDDPNHYWKWNSGYSLASTDDEGNTGGDWQGTSNIDLEGNWVSHQWWMKMDTSTNGFLYLIEDNIDRQDIGSSGTPSNVRLQNLDADKLLLFYNEMTLPSGASGTYHIGLGGYAGNYGSGNWRYYADFYIDNTWSRVVLTDNATYDSATEIVPQIPTAWSASEITVTVNKGRLPSGTAHLFVFDSANARQYIGTVELA